MSDLRNRRDLEAQYEQSQRAEKGPDTLQKAKIRLYDKIKARVSVKAMDIFVGVVAALIVVALIVGILWQ